MTELKIVVLGQAMELKEQANAASAQSEINQLAISTAQRVREEANAAS